MLLLIVSVLICCWFCSVFIRWWRVRNMSSGIYSLPALPFLGHIHLLPKCRYEWSNFFIDNSNRALQDGHQLIRWWIFHRITIWALDAETSKAVLENSVELRKGRDYAFFGQWLGQGLLLSDGDKWRRQRRMLTPTFHFAMLEQYTHVFNRNAMILLDRMSEMAENHADDVHDVGPTLIRCSLDIVTEAIMGVQLDSAKSECREYVKAVKQFNDLAHTYTTNPFFTFIPITWHLFGRAKETRQCVNTLKQFTRRVIEERIKIRAAKAVGHGVDQTTTAAEEEATAPGPKGKAFLDLLLQLEPDTLDREELREQQQLHAEIVQHFGPVSAERQRSSMWLSMSDVNELRYMDRCVKEALRLFPPVPVVERDLVNDMPFGCKGVAPRGTMILVSPLTVHHNEQVYGRHWEFNPDHFLPEAIADRSAFDYIPFSAGPRNCIGQRFALLELKILLAHIFRQFRLSTDIPFRHNRPALEAILRPELGLPVRIHKIEDV
uniref:Cytochrome P450 n=1 Tax=Globodera rostochiensis TaxID=31243 RepID=A0A914H251_GLORO